MKRILISTDYSDNSRDAFEYVLNLVKGSKAEIQVLHVIKPVMVDTPDSAMINAQATELLLKQSKANMEALMKHSSENFLKGSIDKINLETKVNIGNVTDEIVKQADSFQADLIVMGSQGTSHSALGKFFGTVTTKIISSSNCPVILVPFGYKYKKIDNLIFATTLDTGDPFELNRALKLLVPHKPLVRVVHVKDPYDFDNVSKLEAFAKYMVDHSPAIRTFFNVEAASDIENVLSEYSLEHDAELIVMHRSKKRFIQKLFSSSHTKKMAFLAEVPLMVLN